LKKCLPSVLAADFSAFEVILANNASTDGTVDWVNEHFPGVHIVTHPENWAFCRGNNEAIPHARGEYLVLLNNDVEVSPGWLHPLVAALDKDPKVAAVQPKLLQYDDRGVFEYAGGSGGFLDRFGYPFTRGRLFFTLETDRGQYDDARDIFWATGAAIMLRKSALDEVGYLDEAFFMHMEEIDLCWRLHRRGYGVRAIPQSVVYHIGGGSLPQGDARKTYYNFRNSLLMLYKNLPPGRWIRVFAGRLLLDGLAILRALLGGRFGEVRAILRAYLDAHRIRETYDGSRPRSADIGAPPFYRGSIVVDYFLRGLRRFSELPGNRFDTP
jgi:GT2 family glycosyltransferase